MRKLPGDERAERAAERVRERSERKIERIRIGAERKARHAAERARKSLAGRIISAASGAVAAAAVISAVFLAGIRLAGYIPYAILSGSMTPAYNTGDMVYVRYINPLLIRKGDVITYVADSSLTLVTHRVIETRPKEGTVITKGDANDTPDAKPVLMDNIVGTVRFSIPCLGYVSEYLAGTSGRYTVAAVVLTLVIIIFIPDFIKTMARKRGSGDTEGSVAK